MSYAIKLGADGAIMSWRTVESAAECEDGESWQEEQPAVIEATASPAIDPIQKFKSFLAANPDVASALGF